MPGWQPLFPVADLAIRKLHAIRLLFERPGLKAQGERPGASEESAQ